MRGAHKAREMKRRPSQRRAAHKARLAALTRKAETRRAAVEAGSGKTKVGSKGPCKVNQQSQQAREEIAPSLNQRLLILQSSLCPCQALLLLPHDGQA